MTSALLDVNLYPVITVPLQEIQMVKCGSKTSGDSIKIFYHIIRCKFMTEVTGNEHNLKQIKSYVLFLFGETITIRIKVNNL